jgi:murein L,D-transpeptidase YafK
MRDNPMEEIYTLADAAFRNGQPFFRIHIFPFRMTAWNMFRHRLNANNSFWENLREGYLFFEEMEIIHPMLK